MLRFIDLRKIRASIPWDGIWGIFFYVVEVRDCGPGLAEPDKAFEAFFSTKENGLGMGLAICRSIVEAHHGRLWAASVNGAGATFRFTLPSVRVPRRDPR